jgi:predicted transcriptional regulator
MSETSATDRWAENRTTLQRVYDVLVGTQTFATAQEFAERAECSESGARNALEQLAEMGIAERRDGRPTAYRRNDSYFRWKRVETLAREHDPATLRERVEQLVADDEAFQQEYGVPEPDAVSREPIEDHEALHAHWEDMQEWRTIRRDIRLLQRAIDRAESRAGDGLRA